MECGAFFQGAVDVDFSLPIFDQSMGDGQAQSVALQGLALALHLLRVKLVKRGKDFVKHGCRNAGAGVADNDVQRCLSHLVAWAVADVELNLTLGCEFDGVAEQVQKNLGQSRGIGLHPTGQSGGLVVDPIQVFLVRLMLQCAKHLMDQRWEFHRLDGQGELPLVNL